MFSFSLKNILLMPVQSLILSPKDTMINKIVLVYAVIGLRIYEVNSVVIGKKSHNKDKVSNCSK